MATAADGRTRRAWVARPATPIWYGPFARAADWWTARRDARAGLPDLEVDGKVGTPRCEYLGRVARDRAEREWLAYQTECADPLIRLGAAHGRTRAGRERLSSAAAELAAIPATLPESDEQVRRGGEIRRGTDPHVVRARRAREHARLRAACEQRVRAAREELASLERKLADLEARVQVRFQVAQTRARRIDEYARRRGGAYLGQLARRHRQGGSVNADWNPAWPELPDWVYGDRSPHLSGTDDRGEGHSGRE
jgi:hypothetical protein